MNKRELKGLRELGVPCCTKCGNLKADELYVNSWRINKKGKRVDYHRCRSCNTARHKAYRATENGRMAQRRANKRYEERNPHKRKEWRDARKKAGA